MIFASFAWNSEDSKRAIESINSKQLKSGIWESLYETYSAVQTLDMLGVTKFNANSCNELSSQNKNLKKASEIFFYLATTKKLKCATQNNFESQIKELLKKPDESTTEELRYLVGNVPLMGGPEKFGAASLGKLVEIITDRMEDKGIFRSLKDIEDASVLNAGYAFRALAQLYRMKVSNKEQTEMLETSIESLADLIKMANKREDTFSFSDRRVDETETTSVVIDGLFTLLTSVKKSKAPAPFTSSIQSLLNFFVQSQTTTGNPSDIYQVVRSLYLLSRNSLSRPISIALINSRISTSAPGDNRLIKVQVSNAIGTPISGIKVYLTKAKASRSSTVIVERQLMDAADNSPQNTIYQFNLLAAKPTAGSYILSVRVVPDTKVAYYQPTSNDMSVSIVSSVTVSGVNLVISDSPNSKDNTRKQELKYPNNLSMGSVGLNQHLSLSLRVKNEKTTKPLVVSQVFLRVFNEKSSKEIVIASAPKGTLYSFQINLSKYQDFFSQGGLYQFFLIVGDAHIEKGIFWNAFHFEMDENPSGVKASIWQDKPDIEHLFRQPEKRPPAIVSLFFAALVLSPILLIFVGLTFTGFHFGKLPGLGSIYYLLFIAGICLIAFVIVLYWLALNMFTALYYISILLVATVFVGQRALRSKALSSIKKID